jgi:carboxylesterase type B
MLLPLGFAYLLVYSLALAAPNVTAPAGIFLGESTSNGTERFLGIHYAQAPVGSLRFKAPVPVATSNESFNATQFANACPQRPSSSLGAPVGEDCLALNVMITSGVMDCQERLLTGMSGLES